MDAINYDPDFFPIFHHQYEGMNKGIQNPIEKVKFPPPALPYSINALEPIIAAQSLKEHFYNYHMRSFENFLDLIAETSAEQQTALHLLKKSEDYNRETIFELGSWVNHQLYWNNLSPHGGAMSKPFENAMNEQFGNIYNFKIEFIQNALKMRCCGWTWLIKNKSGELEIINTEENINPLMKSSPSRGNPLLVIDMWEHAYFNKYLQDKSHYIKSVWMLINWNEVSHRFENS